MSRKVIETTREDVVEALEAVMRGLDPQARAVVGFLQLKLEATECQLSDALIMVDKLKDEVGALKDEIALLKKGNKRPKIKPERQKKKGKLNSKLGQKRPGSCKRSKTVNLKIDETQVVRPAGLPEGARLRRRRAYVVQELYIKTHNVRYILEDYETAEGVELKAQLPAGVCRGHFGQGVVSIILYLHHQCQVTQPRLLECLREVGLDISAGGLNDILLLNHEVFHKEKEDILREGLSRSSYIQTDDTGARHAGQNGYCTYIGNEFFAWFGSAKSKSRESFLKALSGSEELYRLDTVALKYMAHQKLPKTLLRRLEQVLESSGEQSFAQLSQWIDWLKSQACVSFRHIRIASEGALLAGAISLGLNERLAILSDDAGQFNLPLLLHGLCWIHEERHLKKLLPTHKLARKAQEQVIDDFWKLYERMKEYRKNPTAELKAAITQEFKDLCCRDTPLQTLNLALKRLYKKKDELLLFLELPLLPLHNNTAERDIRDFVTKRKISGGTRSPLGLQARDTFTSLKKTCRKHGISFWHYLTDRISQKNNIPPLALLVRNALIKHHHPPNPLPSIP